MQVGEEGNNEVVMCGQSPALLASTPIITYESISFLLQLHFHSYLTSGITIEYAKWPSATI